MRIIDIPGSASLADPLVDGMGVPAFVDSDGRAVLDAWDTSINEFNTPPIADNGGFDLDAVGARHVVPEPTTWTIAMLAALAALRCSHRVQRRCSLVK